MQLPELCEQTLLAVKTVGDFIRQERQKGFSVEEKSRNSLVTRIDQQSEALLVKALKELLPEAGIIGEEGIDNTQSDTYNWVIDPLDGTTNFIHGIPCYCISVALMHQQEVIIGVVYELNLDECFYGWKNGGAFLNGNKITVSANNQMQNALVATGFPYYDFKHSQAYLNLLEHFMKTTRGVRRLGSAAVDLAYVACGRFDAFYEYSLHPWDVAAGALLVKEAGGVVTDFSGNQDYVFGKEIVASSSLLSSDFLEAIRHYFVKQ
jgi:myo-inositol-1(or 4)-monophosphatase